MCLRARAATSANSTRRFGPQDGEVQEVGAEARPRLLVGQPVVDVFACVPDLRETLFDLERLLAAGTGSDRVEETDAIGEAVDLGGQLSRGESDPARR